MKKNVEMTVVVKGFEGNDVDRDGVNCAKEVKAFLEKEGMNVVVTVPPRGIANPSENTDIWEEIYELRTALENAQQQVGLLTQQKNSFQSQAYELSLIILNLEEEIKQLKRLRLSEDSSKGPTF